MSSQATPVDPSERIVGLDFLRGVAILGILLINVQSISMPGIARTNPSEYGEFAGAEFVVWLFTHIFAEQKFIAIFSILFGAGVLLFVHGKDSDGASVVKLHYRRTFWLLVIGLAHAYLLWDGDILVTYALCSFVVVFARNWNAEQLAIVGGILMSIPFLLRLDVATQLDPGATVGYWTTTEQSIQSEIALHQGGWVELFQHRMNSSFRSQTVSFLSENGWRYGGFMLLGMGLLKWGILSNDRTMTEYRRLAVVGFCSGTVISGAGVAWLFYHDWSGYAGYVWVLFNDVGSVFLAVSYICFAMIASRRWATSCPVLALAAVGRMALSNYLFQTVVATSIFYGYGLGLFGQVSRSGQMLIVAAIWIVQIGLSVTWLHYYRYGPAEHIWRSLTYGVRT